MFPTNSSFQFVTIYEMENVTVGDSRATTDVDGILNVRIPFNFSVSGSSIANLC